MAERAAVPVVLHYDHGLTTEKIYEALALGCTSVMYDCSQDAYAENVRKVAEMAAFAHARGATIEAELGHVGQAADPDESSDESLYTDPAQAQDYAARTGVDALAVAIGSAHGAYKKAPKLDLPRLRAIAQAVPVPLVLHGGSGLSDDDFRNCVRDGIAKINIFTDLNCACAEAIAAAYHKGLGMTDVMPHAVEAVRQAVETKMRLFGCVGRA
jgi:fructose-bisphosphate aldolase class II